jgi:hypothetical protein
MSNYYISKKDGDWNIKKEGAQRVSAVVSTQKEAEKLAKQFSANNGGGEVRIHGLDGKIRDSDTVAPGRDPNPPKDKIH